MKILKKCMPTRNNQFDEIICTITGGEKNE